MDALLYLKSLIGFRRGFGKDIEETDDPLVEFNDPIIGISYRLVCDFLDSPIAFFLENIKKSDLSVEEKKKILRNLGLYF